MPAAWVAGSSSGPRTTRRPLGERVRAWVIRPWSFPSSCSRSAAPCCCSTACSVLLGALRRRASLARRLGRHMVVGPFWPSGVAMTFAGRAWTPTFTGAPRPAGAGAPGRAPARRRQPGRRTVAGLLGFFALEGAKAAATDAALAAAVAAVVASRWARSCAGRWWWWPALVGSPPSRPRLGRGRTAAPWATGHAVASSTSARRAERQPRSTPAPRSPCRRSGSPSRASLDRGAASGRADGAEGRDPAVAVVAHRDLAVAAALGAAGGHLGLDLLYDWDAQMAEAAAHGGLGGRRAARRQRAGHSAPSPGHRPDRAPARALARLPAARRRQLSRRASDSAGGRWSAGRPEARSGTPAGGPGWSRGLPADAPATAATGQPGPASGAGYRAVGGPLPQGARLAADRPQRRRGPPAAAAGRPADQSSAHGTSHPASAAAAATAAGTGASVTPRTCG